MLSSNQVFGRTWEIKIGRNRGVLDKVLDKGVKTYSEQKEVDNKQKYSGRYAEDTTSSNLTTVPAQCITLRNPIQIVAKVVDPKKGDKVNTHKTNIRLYNLSEATYKQIRVGDSVFLRAGYEQEKDAMPHVFIGQIVRVRTFPLYQDTITEIEATATVILENANISKSYPPNTTLKAILSDLANAVGKSGVPVGEINDKPIAQKLMAKAYPSGYVVHGGLLSSLINVCNANGLRAYVTSGRLYIEPKQNRGQLTKVVTIGDGQFKGKIEEKEDRKGKKLKSDDNDTNEDYDLKLNLFLDGNITSNALVKITAKGYEGMYNIKEIEHNLDWKKGDWETNLTLIKVMN